jgi:vacuolar-type H+-ATPase subunit H
MKEAICSLYAHILLFFQKAVKWYNLGPAGRALSSLFKPFELHYEDTVKQIRLCAETIEQIASAAARAEIRDINIMLQLQSQAQKERDQILQEMQAELKAMQFKTYNRVTEVLQVATGKNIAA